MIPISRSKRSKVFDNLFSEMKKEATGLYRASFGIKKEDPFEKHATGDIWFIVEGKLVRNKKKIIKEK